MNLAEFNYLHRGMVQKELILPHPPTYVIQQKHKNNDVWYFTSQKFITLKKKRENTSFNKFIRNFTKEQLQKLKLQDDHDESNQFGQNQISKGQRFFDTPFLLFILKMRTNYIESKIMHIIDSHLQFGSFIKSRHSLDKCTICQQIESNDYDFILMQKHKFLEFLNNQRQENNQEIQNTPIDFSQKIDNVIKTMLFENNQKKQIKAQASLFPKSTFNTYLSSIGFHFKYYVTRIQSIPQKHHYMISNTNRKNYRKTVHETNLVKDNQIKNEKSFLQKQRINLNKAEKTQTQNQLFEKISSAVWNTQYVLFDVQKSKSTSFHQKNNFIKATKVSTNHMKQKITQKCEVLQTFLEKFLLQTFKDVFNNKITKNPYENQQFKGKINFTVNVKQFRLWYMNNNLRNNHVYTICISDLKVQFCMSIDSNVAKRWYGDFWTKIDLKKNHFFNTKVNQKTESYPLSSKRPKTASLFHQSRNKVIQKYKNQKQEVTPNHQKQKSTTKEQILNLGNNFNQKCYCCLQPINTFEKMIPKRFIVYRHISMLRQNVCDEIQNQIKNIEAQLSMVTAKETEFSIDRTKSQIQKENQLIFLLQKKQQTLRIVKNLIMKEKNQKALIIQKINFREDQLKREYGEVLVCDDCYQIFLRRMIKHNVTTKIEGNKIKIKMKENEKKFRSFFIKQSIKQNDKNRKQSRKRVFSTAKNYNTLITNAFIDEQKLGKKYRFVYDDRKILPKSKQNVNSVSGGNPNIKRKKWISQESQQKISSNEYKQRQSTKDNTTILDLFSSKIISNRFQENSINENIKKKKTRLERFEEQIDKQYF